MNSATCTYEVLDTDDLQEIISQLNLPCLQHRNESYEIPPVTVRRLLHRNNTIPEDPEERSRRKSSATPNRNARGVATGRGWVVLDDIQTFQPTKPLHSALSKQVVAVWILTEVHRKDAIIFITSSPSKGKYGFSRNGYSSIGTRTLQ